jgi:hypothetical protein
MQSFARRKWPLSRDCLGGEGKWQSRQGTCRSLIIHVTYQASDLEQIVPQLQFRNQQPPMLYLPWAPPNELKAVPEWSVLMLTLLAAVTSALVDLSVSQTHRQSS